MVFDLCGSVVAQSILRLSLDHFVDKIGSFDRPAPWDVSFLDLHLLRQNVVSDLLSRLANVWPTSEHALISHHTHSKVIDTSSVIDAAHDLRSHVAWRS